MARYNRSSILLGFNGFGPQHWGLLIRLAIFLSQQFGSSSIYKMYPRASRTMHNRKAVRGCVRLFIPRMLDVHAGATTLEDDVAHGLPTWARHRQMSFDLSQVPPSSG